VFWKCTFANCKLPGCWNLLERAWSAILGIYADVQAASRHLAQSAHGSGTGGASGGVVVARVGCVVHALAQRLDGNCINKRRH